MSINRNTTVKLLVTLSVILIIGASFIGNVEEDTKDRARELDPKVEKLKLLPGFKAEHLYSPSENKNGSWVAMAFDDKGRMITCDQYGYLYRLTIPAVGTDSVKSKIKVEKLELKIAGDTSKAKIKMGFAHGLLYAFNSLYVMVNHKGDTSMAQGSGLYRLQDTDNDDQFDKLTLLKELITPGGEHGPHSIVLSPDKQSIYVVAGNFTEVPKMDHYRALPIWQADNLMPLIKDPNGHDNKVGTYGGWVAKIDPTGEKWELISSGYRNPFDLAFNDAGDMFTYDSDMEWDFGMPWYRPTRLIHTTSGSEYGWRPGTQKWSPAYADNLPAVLNIGQGSPTNLISAGNARFPEKYRRSLFAFDWSFGIIYALELLPDGSSYKARAEEFISGSPLPLTDGIIGPDGALYFMTGGRRLDSDLYRVYYGENNLPNAPLTTKNSASVLKARKIRRQLEEFHGNPDATAVKKVWPHLKSNDRFIRFAARIALEHQPAVEWQERALSEKNPQILTQAVIALARTGGNELKGRILNALMTINYKSLTEAQQIDVLRAFELTILRMGKPDASEKIRLGNYLNASYPATNNELNRLLSKILVAIDDPLVVQKTLAMMDGAKDDVLDQKVITEASDLIFRNPQYGLDIAGMLSKTPPAQQIHYATVLSEAKSGWTPDLRDKYFKWFYTGFGFKGGNSYVGFIDQARKTALANVPKDQFEHYNMLSGNALLASSGMKLASVGSPKGPGKTWKMDIALKAVQNDSTNRDFEQGKMMFSANLCNDCHGMRGEGGAVGPDLTQLGTRFSSRDMLEAIIEPSKVISDQYAATTFFLKNGTSVMGRLTNEDKDKYFISQNPFAPQTLREIFKKDVERSRPSEVSIMYSGMINRLNAEELKDLMAYLAAGGNKDHEVYKPKKK